MNKQVAQNNFNFLKNSVINHMQQIKFSVFSKIGITF